MKTYKVVIIDDESWTREAIKQLTDWKGLGLMIAGEASDGEYGLELIRQTSPDIILTDVNMPQLNGIDLVRILRDENNQAQVIFISGYDNFEYIRGALRLDAVDYLLKPIKTEELSGQLKKCVENLKEREHQEVVTGEFLDTTWAAKFYEIKSALGNSLNSSDVKLVEASLMSVEELIKEHTRDHVSKTVMVSVYYTLINLLWQHIAGYSYQVRDIFGTEDTVFVFSQEAAFTEMMAWIRHLYLTACRRIQEKIRHRGRLDIDEVKRYLAEHFAEGITLEQTAEIFYVSKEYLSKIFKQSAGRGFTEYVTALKMERAKELIVDYKIPLKEVAGMVGYVEQAHFYKSFKKFFGKTPGDFKNGIFTKK